MEFLQKVKLIQGGMGVYVSNWRMAKAVAMEKPGLTAGTVSGTGLDWVYARLLQLGDPGGHIHRAMVAFDAGFGIDIGRKIYERYFIDGGKASTARFKNAPQQIVHGLDGSNVIPLPVQPAAPVALTLDKNIIELLIATGFAEVWLAKEGHDGNIFINFLKKVELPLVYTMYGAMLAGVDGVIVGAGNPDGLPAICSRLVNHQAITIDLSVLYREPGEVFYVPFDPRLVADGKLAQKTLRRPAFLAIASLENLVNSLAHSQSEAPDGFIIEHHTAGGHNAGPQGPLQVDNKGQPIYSQLDEPDLQAIRSIGLPFWLAGGYGSREKLQQALNAGAAGVQAGSVFALTEESGMKSVYRTAILNEIKKGTTDAALIQTTLFSPTGFPFKAVQLDDTLANDAVYSARPRVCDIGLLQQGGFSKPDADGKRRLLQRCPAAPVEGFINKRGLPHNTEGRRCLCNGLLSCVGLGQVNEQAGELIEEPAIVTLGNHLDGIRRLSRQGQTPYWVRDVVNDILGD
ncbi:MAG: 2-nitropropane dioxygenase [Chloroflexi bacterium]|nr:MAG: 2-nitropropane dioxygenase [Chloroflexota bacterium]